MSFDQPRQPAGTPAGGRFATTTRAETGLSLTGDLDVVSAGAAALLGHEPDGGPDAMAAMQASETVLRAAESHLASRLGALPPRRPPHQHEKWQLRDDGAGTYCVACGEKRPVVARWGVTPEPPEVGRGDEPVPVAFEPQRPAPRPPLAARLGGRTPLSDDPSVGAGSLSWQQAEYTIRSDSNLEETVRAARMGAVILDRPQTIDHPTGAVWKRTTVYPNGQRVENPTAAPYTRALDMVTRMVRPEELAAATRVVMDHPDRDPRTVAAMAASEMSPQFRPHVEAMFTQVLTQHLQGRAGVNREVIARLPQGTAGLEELQTHDMASRTATGATQTRIAGRLGD